VVTLGEGEYRQGCLVLGVLLWSDLGGTDRDMRHPSPNATRVLLLCLPRVAVRTILRFAGRFDAPNSTRFESGRIDQSRSPSAES